MTKQKVDTSPAKLLHRELSELRRELRGTLRAYTARLEIELAECVAHVAALAASENPSRDQLHEIRDLTAYVRKRKIKPEKGRRKDLRKLDAIIAEMHATTHPAGAR